MLQRARFAHCSRGFGLRRLSKGIQLRTGLSGLFEWSIIILRLLVVSSNLRPLSRLPRSTLRISRCSVGTAQYRVSPQWGFGAIKCRIEDACEGSRACFVTEFLSGIAFAVKTEEPLMLPRQNDESLDHVPGSAVLGFFAAKAQKKGMDAETFSCFFLTLCAFPLCIRLTLKRSTLALSRRSRAPDRDLAMNTLICLRFSQERRTAKTAEVGFLGFGLSASSGGKSHLSFAQWATHRLSIPRK